MSAASAVAPGVGLECPVSALIETDSAAAATSRVDFAKEIYARYCNFSREHREKPFSYGYFYSSLSYLQSIGLVALVSTKQGRTYANRAVLTFEPSMARQICSLRFEK